MGTATAKVSLQSTFELAKQAYIAKKVAEEAYEKASADLISVMEEMDVEKYSDDDYKVNKLLKFNSEVDAKIYKDCVTPQEFLDSIKVSVTKARAYLPKRLHEKCIVETPGKPYLKFGKA